MTWATAGKRVKLEKTRRGHNLQTCDWDSIVKDYGPLVWQTAYRLLSDHSDAADCFQDTFLKAFELSRHQEVRNMAALLTRLATMRAIDCLRQRTRHKQREMDTDEWQGLSAAATEPLSRMESRELAEQLAATLCRLPVQEANVFCLRYLSDMSYREIGKQLNIKPGTAGVLLHRARATLRKTLVQPCAANDEVLS